MAAAELWYDITDGLVRPSHNPAAPIIVFGVPTPQEREFLLTEL